MRTYWLKIALGAFAVFAVGMALRAAFLVVRARVREVARTSDPITIPLAFVPFRLEGARLGTFDQAVLIRKSPRQISSVRLGVKLTDSTASSRLSDCDLLAHFSPDRHGPADGPAVEFNDAEFSCVKGDSVEAHGAERFGEVGFEPGGLSLALYVPSDVARNLRREWSSGLHFDAEQGANGEAMGDSIAAAAERMGDSISEAAARFGDSMARVGQLRGDSIARAARRHADSMRKNAHHLRDSLRALHGPR
jgi:hypothetical protein